MNSKQRRKFDKRARRFSIKFFNLVAEGVEDARQDSTLSKDDVLNHILEARLKVLKDFSK